MGFEDVRVALKNTKSLKIRSDDEDIASIASNYETSSIIHDKKELNNSLLNLF